jgi:hypothetical protein
MICLVEEEMYSLEWAGGLMLRGNIRRWTDGGVSALDALRFSRGGEFISTRGEGCSRGAGGREVLLLKSASSTSPRGEPIIFFITELLLLLLLIPWAEWRLEVSSLHLKSPEG